MRFLPRHRLGALALAGGVISLCILGCGYSTGDVSGKVTFKGEPLKGGIVTFAPTAAEAPSFTAAIQEDGTYSIQGLRAGEYKVCVETESLKPRMPGSVRGGGGSMSGPPGGRGGKGSGAPPGSSGGGPPDLMKNYKSGKIKTDPTLKDSEEPEDVRSKRGKDGFAYMMENMKNYVPIPPNYANPDTTPLTFTATKGSQTFDIPVAAK